MNSKYSFLMYITIFSLFTLLNEIKYSHKIVSENRPSGRADGFSEANSLRGSLYLKEKGLFYNAGLPNLGHGEIYPKHGRSIEIDDIYTHYPPGPEYVLYFYRLLTNDIFTFRLINIFLCFIIMTFFLNELFSILNKTKSALIPLISLSVVPIFYNTMHGLHQTTYCFYLNILIISLVFLFLRGKLSIKKLYTASFLISFLQGWMTFDYFFLVTFGTAPFLLLFRADNKVILKIMFFNFIGFSIAHGLHFIQVIYFFGGIEEAINDFLGAAKTRSLESTISLSSVFYDYFSYYIRRSRYFNFKIQYLLVIHTFFFIRDYFVRKNNLKSSLTSPLVLSLLSLLISSLWLIVMKQHASIHTHFIPRHYYPFYMMLVLSIYLYIVNNNEIRNKKNN